VYQIVDESDPNWSWLPMANRRIWTALATLLALPTVHIGGYRKISILSAAGTLILVAVTVMGITISARSIARDGVRGHLQTSQLSNIPAAFSIFLFAFSCHGIFPALEASMAEPERFGCVVSAVFISNIIIKAVFGLIGFFAFGAVTNSVITTNFEPYPRLVISVLVALNTLFSFPLPLVPVFKALKHAQGGTTSAACDALQRTVVVLICGVVAIAVPNFGVAMGFMGSLTLPFLTFVFPTVFYVRLHRQRLHSTTIVWSYTVACVGALGCVAGLFSNIMMVVQGKG